MHLCDKCGKEIEFRYIGGRSVPLHVSGGCGESGEWLPPVDLSGYTRSEESSCYLTKCPDCGAEVFFIRHNGGSVWIDPPLGWPWDKHHCMDNKSSPSQSQHTPSGSIPQDRNVVVGVVRAVYVSSSGSCTLLQLQTGDNQDNLLLLKSTARVLVGAVALYDVSRSTISSADNANHSFKVISPLQSEEEAEVELTNVCPECSMQVRQKELREHLRAKHGIDLGRRNLP